MITIYLCLKHDWNSRLIITLMHPKGKMGGLKMKMFRLLNPIFDSKRFIYLISYIVLFRINYNSAM